MDVIIFDEDEEYTSKKDYGYIENSIKKYAKKNNFPKNLVLIKLQNEIEKREKVNKEVVEKLDTFNKALVKIKKDKEILTKDNTSKINKLLNIFSTNNF